MPAAGQAVSPAPAAFVELRPAGVADRVPAGAGAPSAVAAAVAAALRRLVAAAAAGGAAAVAAATGARTTTEALRPTRWTPGGLAAGGFPFPARRPPATRARSAVRVRLQASSRCRKTGGNPQGPPESADAAWAFVRSLIPQPVVVLPVAYRKMLCFSLNPMRFIAFLEGCSRASSELASTRG